MWGDPDVIYGAGGALTALLANLKAIGLDPSLTKFQVTGTTPDACANKPAWPKGPFSITDPIKAARVAEAEAASKEQPQLSRQQRPKMPTSSMQ